MIKMESINRHNTPYQARSLRASHWDREPRPGIWDGRSGWWYEDGLFTQTYLDVGWQVYRHPRFLVCYYCSLEYKDWYLHATQETLDAQAARLAALP